MSMGNGHLSTEKGHPSEIYLSEVKRGIYEKGIGPLLERKRGTIQNKRAVSKGENGHPS